MRNRVLSLAGVFAVVAALALPACGDSRSVGSGAGAVSNSGSAATAVVGKQTYTTSDAVIPVMDGHDGTHAATIDTRLYLPANATAATPQPVILMTNGFGLDKLAGEIVSMADYLARHGYIVLTYSGQGFGGSSGCIRLDSYDYDVKDSQQLIDKMLVDPAFKVGDLSVASVVARDAKGPLIGLIGGSYGGGIVLNMAATDPRVRAAIPGRTWNSLQYALNPNNLITAGDATGFAHQRAQQGVFKFEWTSLFFASGNAGAAQGQGGCPEEKAMSGEPAMVAGAACAGFPTEVCQTYATLTATGDADDAIRSLVANSSVETRIDQLTVPTMLVQGQSDTLFNPNDAVATYVKLKARQVPVAMIWNSGGHGGYNSLPGECEVYGSGTTGLDQCYLTQRALAWFNRYLRGDTAVDTGPGFAFYRDWVANDGSGSAHSQYGQAAGFPAQAMQTFYLSGTADLVAEKTQVVAGSATVLNPAGGTPSSYTETSNFTGPSASPSASGMAPSDPAGQFANFTSAPFERDVVSVGVPRARLNIANRNTRDLVFFGKVWDVDAAGNATLIKRLIAPVRVPAAEVGKPVEFNLVGFAHRFAKGHRVRLSIASTDMTSYNAKVADVLTITTGGNDPASFSLPVDAAP